MSLPVYAPTSPSPLQGGRSKRPHLELVSAPVPARSSVPFVLLLAAILFSALVGALLLNTAMAAASYRIHDQRVALNLLTEQQAELTAQVESLGSPSALQERAASLGMVPAGELVYLSVADKAASE